jgi:hypothetical protein
VAWGRRSTSQARLDPRLDPRIPRLHHRWVVGRLKGRIAAQLPVLPPRFLGGTGFQGSGPVRSRALFFMLNTTRETILDSSEHYGHHTSRH